MKANGIKQAVEGLLKPPEPPKPVEVKVPEAPKPPEAIGKGKRTLGSIYVALEAQRVYNGAIPSTPTPEAPPANLQGQGTAPNLGTTGAWGKPEAK
jgi:hypothetical protein